MRVDQSDRVRSFLFWLFACGYFKTKRMKGRYEKNWPWFMCN
jgi:hypothetical protein